MDSYKLLVKDVVYKLIDEKYKSSKKARARLEDILVRLNEELPEEIHEKIDQILQYELKQTKLIDTNQLPKKNSISIIKADITTLKVDVIVNAANSRGLGCFTPKHKCIDNVIHCKAGPKLREECSKIMNGPLNKHIPIGKLIATHAYNLPCKYVFHVVGPIYDKSKDLAELRKKLCESYVNCLSSCVANGAKSIAFCCISTGVFGYPHKEAAFIALNTVKSWLKKNDYDLHVIFCTYLDEDFEVYNKLITLID
jgi:O-acetyl-ADP-ribose deacetylase (regulator of RNase III)